MASKESWAGLIVENKISVLMSVYKKEDAEFFNRAMQSIWDDQTKKPDEIIIIRDGPLTLALDNIMQFWQERLGGILRQVYLEKNGGLGSALRLGVGECTYELIARMDTDDISLPHRFERQVEFLKKNLDVDVVGSFVSEFEGHESNIYAYRRLPLTSDELIKFSKSRCPLNHVSVMFKKSKVIAAGNYGHQYFSQDYFLWSRLLMNGAKFANIPEVLVNVRAGTEMIRRRGGGRYASIEYQIQKEFLSTKFITVSQFIKNILIRVPVRLLPQSARVFVYKLIRRYL